MGTRPSFGIDIALRAPDLLRGRVGFVTNDAARTACAPRRRSRRALLQAGVEIVRLFAPEHGLGACLPDGTKVADGVDLATGLPVHSLYGDLMSPSREEMSGLDLMLFDIPDVGARFYTYIWTLWHLLEACAEVGLPLVVLDRPNPIGGDLGLAEGPMLEVERFGSFLGRASIPVRHSLTVGELAMLWNAEAKRKADLRVIRCEGWKRQEHWPETGLPFQRTSPAIPDFLSALLYPGACLFEATNLSAGRGTDRPFQIVAAPWLEAEAISAVFNAHQFPGLKAEAGEIMPTQNPWANQACRCIGLIPREPKSVRPVAAALALLGAIISAHRNEFHWADYPTAANPSGKNHFERLVGQAGIREFLERYPDQTAERLAEWTATGDWAARVGPFLLY